ncbi:hypothetical protein [Clostridium aminobutyricum]|uniref:Uncharacterized protein n=1 Tax=Clostridium aminobutyricum TaxID=33953 RepID=A0A939IFZ8_CLOAM|nr:hypothetical protein [Clostridium aminobutyricum]MBN7772285.1 hypothetical protein [Clostridium aminobutyricum]
MALEDIRRNAKRDIENDIQIYLKGQKNKSNYNYVFSKIDLAAKVSLITIDETKEYISQIRNEI